MMSEAQYKTVYAIYCFSVSLMILGLHYINHTRLVFSLRGFDWAHRRNLVQVGIICAIAVIICAILMLIKRLRFSAWKFIYGIVSAAIIFFMEFIMVTSFEGLSTSAFAFLKLLSVVCSLVLCVVLAGLIIYGCWLKAKSNLNILFDDDCEVVSAVFIANIAVMLVTVLAYVLLC